MRDWNAGYAFSLSPELVRSNTVSTRSALNALEEGERLIGRTVRVTGGTGELGTITDVINHPFPIPSLTPQSSDMSGAMIDWANGRQSYWYLRSLTLIPEHNAYPHEPGMLYDCAACESACHCTIGHSECIYDGPHNGLGIPDTITIGHYSRYAIRHTFPNGEMIGNGLLNVNGVVTRYTGAEATNALDRMHAFNPGHNFTIIIHPDVMEEDTK